VREVRSGGRDQCVASPLLLRPRVLVVLFVTDKVSVMETWSRGRAAGPVGTLDLSWGMSPAAARAALVKGGYVVQDERHTGANAMNAPNAPNGMERAPRSSIEFKSPTVWASASFATNGLDNIQVSVDYKKEEAARERVADIERALGKPTWIKSARESTWSKGATDATVQLRKDTPSGKVWVYEKYVQRAE